MPGLARPIVPPENLEISSKRRARDPLEGEPVCAQIRWAAYNLRNPDLLAFWALDPPAFPYRRFDPAASPAPCICPDIARTGSKPRTSGVMTS